MPAKPKLDAALFAQTFALQMSKADQRKAAIIEAAVGQIARHGLTSAIFEQVSTQLGIRRSHVNYYFKTREELLLSCLQYSLATAQRLTIDRLQEVSDREEGLATIVTSVFDWVIDYPEQARVFLLFHFFAAIDPDFSRENAAFRATAQERIAGMLALGSKPSAAGKKACAKLAQQIHAEIMGHLIEGLSIERGARLAEYRERAVASISDRIRHFKQ